MFVQKVDSRLYNRIIITSFMKFNRNFALETEKYPEIYQRYLEKEDSLVKSLIRREFSVLDVGCGTGRTIPLVARRIRKYTGIDIDESGLEKSKSVASNYPNSTVSFLDATKLDKKYPKNSFDLCLCLWNTIGCVNDPVETLKQMGIVTKGECFFTVMAKGTIEKRKEYYEKLKIDYTINTKSETFYSPIWGESRAYSEDELKTLCSKSGLEISSISKIENLAYAIVARRR